MVVLRSDETLLLVRFARFRRFVRRGNDVLRSSGRGVAILHDQQDDIVAIEQCRCTPVSSPLCQKPPSPMMARTRRRIKGAIPGAAGQAHPVAENGVA